MKLEDKRKIVENTPWHLLTPIRFEEFAYSGLMLKVFRINKGWNNKTLGYNLGIMRGSSIVRLENKERIGIKLAKQVAELFDIPEYRIFRQKDKLDAFAPSSEARETLIEATKFLEEKDIFIIKLVHSLDSKGKESLKATVRTLKRSFPEQILGIPLEVVILKAGQK